jgi:hypothetical protein
VNSKDDRQPPDRYLIPVEGLKVPRPWAVGRVTLHPGSTGEELIRNTPPFEVKDDVIRAHVLEILGSANESSIAEVPGGDIDSAIDEVRAALDALRLFQLSRLERTSATFGLPGDLYRSRIEYVSVWKNSAPGGRFRGEAIGWEFNQDSYDDWCGSTGFQFLSASLADPSKSEGARRAAVGAQLLARAAREHRPDLKMLGVASALEAWLLRRQPGAQTLRLARHVTWFGCGRRDNSLCGRDRPICPYLHLSPDVGQDHKRLKVLRDLGDAYVTWRCSEWHRVMDWYDARSGAAHGDPTAVDTKHAEFWVTHYLMEPILDWLREHPDDPVGDLEATLAAIDDPEGWQAMVDALDAPTPPAAPPIPNATDEAPT